MIQNCHLYVMIFLTYNSVIKLSIFKQKKYLDFYSPQKNTSAFINILTYLIFSLSTKKNEWSSEVFPWKYYLRFKKLLLLRYNKLIKVLIILVCLISYHAVFGNIFCKIIVMSSMIPLDMAFSVVSPIFREYLLLNK